MQIVIEIQDAPIEDYQDLYYKIHGMAASEGLFDDKKKSQRALALKVVLNVLDGVVKGTPLPKGHGDLQVSVIDKIRAEIDVQEKWLLQAGYNRYNVDIAFDAIKHLLAESEE